MKKLSAILIKFGKNQILSLVYRKICSKMWESKFRVKIEPMIFILLFEICFFCYYLLHIEVIKDRRNIVEDAVTFRVKKKKHLNFVDMENSLCTNSSFIKSVQNLQSRFLIQLKFKPCIFLFFLTPIFILCAIFWVFLLKTGVLVHIFWIYTYIRKSDCI